MDKGVRKWRRATERGWRGRGKVELSASGTGGPQPVPGGRQEHPLSDYPVGPVCRGPSPAPAGKVPPPARGSSPPSLRPPPLGRLPCPPAARLMSWLRGGLMGMSEQPPAPPGDSGGRRGGQDAAEGGSLASARAWASEPRGRGRWAGRLSASAPSPGGSTGPLPRAWAPCRHSSSAQMLQGCRPLSLPGVLHTWGQGRGLTPLVGAGDGAGALAGPGWVAGRVGGTWGGGKGQTAGEAGMGCAKAFLKTGPWVELEKSR